MLNPQRIHNAFDPESIKPGLYVTRSGSAAYPAARFLIESGKASGLEHFLPDGQIDLTFEVIGKSKRNPAEDQSFERTGTIKVTKKWFKSRTREYANWKIAWWREAIQNSINPHTGNASRVDLLCKEGPDGNWIVSCSDNGRGMTREQIEDEEKGFLVFGGSGASAYGSMGGIGGFGEAKQLLIFPWLQYRVVTADQEYVGSGQDWKARATTPRQGVLLEVIMPADSHTTPEDAMHVLKRSWLPQVTFTLNGSVVGTGLPVTGQPLDQVDGQGIIYSYPKIRNEAPELVVRKGGLWTFSKALPPAAKHGIIVEVTGESTQMFTTNRDGFGYAAHKLEQKLTESIREISTEGRLRAKLKPVERIVRGTGKFSTAQKKEQELPKRSYEVRDIAGPLPPVRDASEGTKLSDEAVGKIVKKLEGFTEADIAAIGDVTPGEGAASGAGSAIGLETLVQIATASPAAAAVMLQVMNFKGQKSMDTAIKQMVWKPDFLLLKDADMPYVIPKKFTPEDMTPAVLRLTKTWTELCRFILISIGEEATYGVGFWFSTDAAAGYLFRKGEHWLLLNPHKDESRKDIWTPTKQEDLAMLWAMAIHEVSHMLVRAHQGYGYEDDDAPPEPASHGSEMANEQTHLQAKLAASWMTVRKISSSIKLRGQVPGSERPVPPPSRRVEQEKTPGPRFDAEMSLRHLYDFLEAYRSAAMEQTSEDRLRAQNRLEAFIESLVTSTPAYNTGKGYRGVIGDLLANDKAYRSGILIRIWPDSVFPEKFQVRLYFDPKWELSSDDIDQLLQRVANIRAAFYDDPIQDRQPLQSINWESWDEEEVVDLNVDRSKRNPATSVSSYGELQVHALPKGRFGIVHAPTGTWLTRRQPQDRAQEIAKHFGTGGGQALLKAALAGDQGAMDAVSLAVSEATTAKKRARIRAGKSTNARS